MANVTNLSPLAFEILKYLCNTNTADAYQPIDKDTLGISTQEYFLNALAELYAAGLILLNRDPGYVQSSTTEEYATEAIMQTENTDNTAPISARLNNANGDVCKEIDYYLGAE